MRKSLSEKSRKVIEGAVEVLKSIGSLAEVVRIGAKMMLQSALEEEVTAYLQRDYYERVAESKGTRNGSKSRTIKTGCGDITVEMPQVRETAPFHCQLLPPRVTRMEELTEMIPLLYLHGISTRKVKKAVGKALGQKGLSHQNVVRLTAVVVKEFSEWRKRDLSEIEVVYVILDGVRLAVRGGTTEKEAVLVAWAFLGDGSRELLAVSLGNQESYSAWKGFLDGLLAVPISALRCLAAVNSPCSSPSSLYPDNPRRHKFRGSLIETPGCHNGFQINLTALIVLALTVFPKLNKAWHLKFFIRSAQIIVSEKRASRDFLYMRLNGH